MGAALAVHSDALGWYALWRPGGEALAHGVPELLLGVQRGRSRAVWGSMVFESVHTFAQRLPSRGQEVGRCLHSALVGHVAVPAQRGRCAVSAASTGNFCRVERIEPCMQSLRAVTPCVCDALGCYAGTAVHGVDAGSGTRTISKTHLTVLNASACGTDSTTTSLSQRDSPRRRAPIVDRGSALPELGLRGCAFTVCLNTVLQYRNTLDLQKAPVDTR